MRYHAGMQFRVNGELAGAYGGMIGTIKAIDFVNRTIELEMRTDSWPDGKRMITDRRAVKLVNHENCDAPCGCAADTERTEEEP